MNGDAGKGSARRPRDDRYCTLEQYAQRFDATFGKGKGDGKGKAADTPADGKGE